MTSRAVPLYRAAHCPQRRWGARLLTTAHWARSPTSWWSLGLICTSVKSAALWAIPAPEVSLRQMGKHLRWWQGREKMEVCVGHCQASARGDGAYVTIHGAAFPQLHYSWVCLLPLLSLSNSVSFFIGLSSIEVSWHWFALFPCLLPSLIFDYSRVAVCKRGHIQVTSCYPGHLQSVKWELALVVSPGGPWL